MIFTIVILSLFILLLSYIIYNMLMKNERCEDIILTYEKWIIKLSNTVVESDNELKKIDSKGTFESDDEVGFFFAKIKDLQEQLNRFKIN